MGGESEGVNKVSARRMRLCQVASGLERERHCDAICITRLSVVVDVTRPFLVVECKGKGEISGDSAANFQSPLAKF